jgi:hypothetical protein
MFLPPRDALDPLGADEHVTKRRRGVFMELAVELSAPADKEMPVSPKLDGHESPVSIKDLSALNFLAHRASSALNSALCVGLIFMLMIRDTASCAKSGTLNAQISSLVMPPFSVRYANAQMMTAFAGWSQILLSLARPVDGSVISSTTRWLTLSNIPIVKLPP